MLDALWNILRVSNEQETEVSESSSFNVIVNVRDSTVKKLLNSSIVRCSSVSATDCIHGSVPNDRVLGSKHLLDESVSLLLSAEDLEGKTDRESSDDLLMSLILDMVEHILDRFLITGTDHNETHSICSGLSDDGRVSVVVEGLFELCEHFLVLGGHSDETESKTDTVHDWLLLSTVPVAIDEVVDEVLRALVLMDESVGKVSTGARVWRAWLLSCPMEVRVQERESVLLVATVDDTQGGSSVESIPVCGLGNPLDVILQEGVVRGVGIHHSVGPDGGSVKN